MGLLGLTSMLIVFVPLSIIALMSWPRT
uniref:Uncharacterized protein n=1 Tax=Rhizophora mucronata TaxID=61149 RepID=A0A2P2J1E1_RHIMU